MSERPLSETVQQVLAGQVVRPCLFVYADFPSGAKRLWTGTYDVQWNGQTWQGVGGLISFDGFAETVDTTAQPMTAKLNALDASIVADIIASEYQGRECAIWLGFILDDGSLEVVTEPLFKGFLDSDHVQDTGDGAELTIRAENRLIDQLKPRDWRYTHHDQQLLYPDGGDLGLEFVEKIQDQQIPWGRAG